MRLLSFAENFPKNKKYKKGDLLQNVKNIYIMLTLIYSKITLFLSIFLF